MIDLKKIFNIIPFENQLSRIHHVGFLIPYDMSNIDISSICEKNCIVEILNAEVGFIRYNDLIIELIRPINKKSILYNASSKIDEITFDHFGYLKSDASFLLEKKFLKISKFYTCLFETDVEFLIFKNTKIEIVHDNF